MYRREDVFVFLMKRFPDRDKQHIHAYASWLYDISVPIEESACHYRLICKIVREHNELIEPIFHELGFIRWLATGAMGLPSDPTNHTFDPIDSNFVEGELLGKGTYGLVVRGTYKGTDVALKQFCDIDRITAPKYHDPWYTYTNEVALLQEIREKCGDIVGQIHCTGWYQNKMCLVLQRHHIKSSAFRKHETYNGETAESVCRQLFRAIDDIHTKTGYVHCDIKPDNVMIDFDEDRNPHVRIIDFGLSRRAGIVDHSHQYVETLFWRAPELLSEEICELIPTDTWATAITALDIMIGSYCVYLLGGSSDMAPAKIYSLLVQHCLNDDVIEIPIQWSKYIREDLKEFANKIFKQYIVMPEKRATLKEL